MDGPISGFGEACRLARALHRRFVRGHVLLVFGRAGEVACLFLEEGHFDPDDVRELTPEGRFVGLADSDALYLRLSGDDHIDPTNPAHVDSWYSLVASMRRRGARLLDCFLVTAEGVCSLRMATASGEGWLQRWNDGPAA